MLAERHTGRDRHAARDCPQWPRCDHHTATPISSARNAPARVRFRRRPHLVGCSQLGAAIHYYAQRPHLSVGNPYDGHMKQLAGRNRGPIGPDRTTVSAA